MKNSKRIGTLDIVLQCFQAMGWPLEQIVVTQEKMTLLVNEMFLPDPGVPGVRSMGLSLCTYIHTRALETLLMMIPSQY